MKECVKGCQLLNCNDVVESNHRACAIDVDIEECFQEDFIGWDNVNRVMLNPSKRIHRNSFVEPIEE